MKVEVELPDLPGNMEYVPTPSNVEMEMTCPGWDCRRNYRVSADFHVIEKKPPYPAPEGYEFTGEYRRMRKDEWFLAESRDPGKARQAVYDETQKSRWILRKKKPTYTEAVKAAGWKWPKDLHPKWRYFGLDHTGETGTIDTVGMYRDYDRRDWIFTTPGWPDVAFTWPPRLADQYEWHETLLCRDDFI